MPIAYFVHYFILVIKIVLEFVLILHFDGSFDRFYHIKDPVR